MAEPLPVVAARGLVKRFGALVATDHVSLDLRPAEIHALIGPNGAGKTTLLAQIAGELAPDAGQVLLGGDDVTALGAAGRARRGLARSFQVSELVPGRDVLDNLLLAVVGRAGRLRPGWRPLRRRREAVAEAMAALERVGIADLARLPVDALAHGQRRLVEIAIALALRPRALLMDEPMAGLGPDGARRLAALLDGLRAEAPILLVEHDMDAVFALADRITVLDYGRVIASGTPDEIRRDAEVRRAYLGAAAGAEGR